MDEVHNREERGTEDRFSRFMFGRSREVGQSEHQSVESSPPPAIDYEKIMNDFDSLIESARNLKPLFQKVYPLVREIWKNK